MASTRQSSRTTESNEPSVSSYLLGTGNSGSRYTSGSEASQRPVTPAESIIRQNWYYTLKSTLLDQWENIRDLYAGSWRAFFGGKLEAILRFFCLPCNVLTRALNGRRRYFRYQTGIMYLYVYLCATVVLNLVVALKSVHFSMAENIQKCFVILSMVVAIILMSYLYERYETVIFPHSRSTSLRIFYEGGTCLFGFSSFAYSVCVVIDYVSCGQLLDAIVAAMKAMFTVSQILFLHYFYGASIPEDTPYIQVTLAHLLGTNLGLWFWTLCSEQAGEMLEECIHYPIYLGRSDNYFSPLFVEYLLLAASLFYQIWKGTLSSRETDICLTQRHCPTCYCHIQEASRTVENSQSEVENINNTTSNTTRTTRTSRTDNPSSGLGFFIGGCFAALFIVLVLMSTDTGASHQDYHRAYSVGIFVLYFTQVSACYICQLALQSHQRDPGRTSLDHEDILLYFSLAGILLWEGFHAYSLILSGLNNGSILLDLAKDTLAIVQHLFQTTTLIDLRRHQSTQGQSSVWLCQCVLFLLITNLILWVQDSFFFEVDITTPGERYIKMQHDLKTIGYIVHPLSIFFRFHSSVCCVIAWSIFRTGT